MGKFSELKLAAVDIGSNAIRMQISNALIHENDVVFKKVEYIRFPLRLGADVFTFGKITQKNEEKFVKLMQNFKNFVELYETDDYMACATSAMREASNGEEIALRVYYNIGLKINIIDGQREAELINKSIYNYIQDGNYLHIDVGGGSTELNVYVNRQKINSKSYPLGSVRHYSEETFFYQMKEIREWLSAQPFLPLIPVIGIGTGGNINKLFELTEKKKGNRVKLKHIEQTANCIANMSLEERLFKLKLNHDRADVIVPASRIYLEILHMVGAKEIIVPDMGLKDGIIISLYENFKKNNNRFGISYDSR
ncbi:MAG: phosphatase [Cytophagales bacterium]|nr:phosphatase [Cytophagales bacterium]MDW8383684.1 phosphatase [Flammeovirgaceae bacterium]